MIWRSSAANVRNVSWVGKDDEPSQFDAETQLEFMSHHPGLADDMIGAPVSERIEAARQVAGVRTECFRDGSVLTNNDPSSSGKERFQSEHNEVEVSDSGKNEGGPEFPNEAKQAETAVADALCA